MALIFHRVIPGFMVQGGALHAGFHTEKKFEKTIPNESGNGLSQSARQRSPWHALGRSAFGQLAVLSSTSPTILRQSLDSANLEPIKDPIRGQLGLRRIWLASSKAWKLLTSHRQCQSQHRSGPFCGQPAPVIPIVIKKMSRISIRLESYDAHCSFPIYTLRPGNLTIGEQFLEFPQDGCNMEADDAVHSRRSV